MKKLLLVLVVLSSCTLAFAQGEVGKWSVHVQLGVNMNNWGVKNSSGNIFIIVVFIIVVIAVAAAYAAKRFGLLEKRFKKDDEPSESKDEKEENKSSYSYKDEMDDYEDPLQDEYTDEDDADEEEEEYDEDDEYLDDGDEGYSAYVETGKTGLLNPEDRPTDNGGGMVEDAGEGDSPEDAGEDEEDFYFSGM